MTIPMDPAERAERIVGTINIIVHRYPFPKAIDGIPENFSKFRPEPIVFTDFEYLSPKFLKRRYLMHEEIRIYGKSG